METTYQWDALPGQSHIRLLTVAIEKDKRILQFTLRTVNSDDAYKPAYSCLSYIFVIPTPQLAEQPN